jgi:hypothetical protein
VKRKIDFEIDPIGVDFTWCRLLRVKNRSLNKALNFYENIDIKGYGGKFFYNKF